MVSDLVSCITREKAKDDNLESVLISGLHLLPNNYKLELVQYKFSYFIIKNSELKICADFQCTIFCYNRTT